MPSKNPPIQILLHSDVRSWIEANGQNHAQSATSLITGCIADWVHSSSDDKELAWAHLVYAAHSAPHGEGVRSSFRLSKEIVKVCNDAADRIAGTGWQSILNAIVRLKGVCAARLQPNILAFQPDEHAHIRCLAGEREFLVSSPSEGAFSSLETWRLKGAELDAAGRVIISGATFEDDGIVLISGTSGNKRVQKWWPEICGLLWRITPENATKEDAIDLWWRAFSTDSWNAIELAACELWTRSQIEEGRLRIDQAAKILEGSRSYVIWRAKRLNDGHKINSGKTLKPLNKRRRAIVQLTQNIGTLDPSKNVLTDVARALQIHDGTIPSEQEVENALKRMYEDGYARLPQKRG